MIVLAEKLRKQFEPIEPMDFYREIFPEGELDDLDAMTHGKYTGIAVEILSLPDGSQRIKRYTVTDDLGVIDELQQSGGFCILAPISYIGKSRKSENARLLYALVVELDNLIEEDGLERLIAQWSDRVDWIPRPTYTVASGTGLHLYYLFEKPIPLFPNVVKELQRYKRELTIKIWNRHVTTDIGDKVQQESLFQPFRMVGTLTKAGEKTVAFRTGEPVSIQYMNHFVREENRVTQIYKSSCTLAEAREKYPDWYEKRIVQGKPKGHWVCKRDLYDWWKRRIEVEAVVGHRYYCLMILAIYAVKCDISQEELEKDCFELMTVFEGRTDKETNHFTEKDVVNALQTFEDKGVFTYPLNSIVNRSGIEIKRNKRNGRKQAVHVRVMNAIREVDYPNGEWRNKEGRPKGSGIAYYRVQRWRSEHPDGKKIECHRETGLSRVTIDKWWAVDDDKLRSFTKRSTMVAMSVDDAQTVAQQIVERVKEIAEENQISEEQAYDLFLHGQDELIFADSEITVGMMDRLAKQGVRSISVVPDDEYGEVVFDKWLMSQRGKDK